MQRKTKIIAALAVFVLCLVLSLVNFFLNGIVLHLMSFATVLSLLYLLWLNKQSILFQLLFVFLLLEIGLRIFSPYKSYIEQNGALEFIAPYFPHPTAAPYVGGHIQYDNKPEFNYKHVFNSMGYKDEESKQKNYKIFLLGDSFVQGIGTDSVHTIDKLLEGHLECTDCVFNMGLGGNELNSSFKQLKDISNTGFTANFVMLNLNKTDVNDLRTQTANIEGLDGPTPSLSFQFFYGFSYIFRHIAHDLFHYQSNLLRLEEEKALNEQVLSYIENLLYDYQQFCQENNMEFILVFQPLSEECRDEKYSFATLIEKLEKSEKNLGIINLLEIFEGDCSMYYWEKDLHFNTNGYTHYTQSLYEQLIERYPEIQE